MFVDVKKLSKNADGKWVVKGVGGEDLIIDEKSAKLEKPFVQIRPVGNTLTFKSRDEKNSTDPNKSYNWRENKPGDYGLTKVKNEGDYLYCNYADGRKVYYLKYGYKLGPQQLANIKKHENITIRNKNIYTISA